METHRLSRMTTQQYLINERTDLDTIQKNIQMKLMDFDTKVKWIDAIILPILFAYKQFASDIETSKITLQVAQSQYNEKVQTIMDKAKKTYKSWLKEREKEVNHILEVNYRTFTENNELSLFKKVELQSAQSDLEEKIKQTEIELRQSPEDYLKQALLEFSYEQKKTLSALIKKIEEIELQKRQNPSFIAYKKYYDSKRQEFDSLDEYQKLLERAQAVALRCFKFAPQPLFALDTFRSMIQLDSIKDSSDDPLIPSELIELTAISNLIQKEVISFQSMQDLLMQSQMEHQESAQALARKKQNGIEILQNRSAKRASNPGKIIDIWDACKRGSLEDVKRFPITSDKIHNLHEVFDKTLLDYAMERKNLPIIQYLLSKNAHPEIINATGFSTLHRAASMGNFEGIQACIKSSQSIFHPSIDLNQLSETEPPLTPLNIAIQPSLLFKAVSKDHETSALVKEVYPTWKDQVLPIVKALIAAGAKIGVENSRSSLELAISNFIHHTHKKHHIADTLSSVIYHLIDQGNPSQEDILKGLQTFIKKGGSDEDSINVFKALLKKYPTNKKESTTQLLNLLKLENSHYQQPLIEHFKHLLSISKLSRECLRQSADEHTLPYIQDHLTEEKVPSLSHIFTSLVSPRSRSPQASPTRKSRSRSKRSASESPHNTTRRGDSLIRSASNYQTTSFNHKRGSLQLESIPDLSDSSG